MNFRPLDKSKIKENLNSRFRHFEENKKKINFINPLHFDCPPPVYGGTSDMGWTAIAKAIIGKQGEFSKLIRQAKRWKKKEEEWKSLPFLCAKIKDRSKLSKTFNSRRQTARPLLQSERSMKTKVNIKAVTQNEYHFLKPEKNHLLNQSDLNHERTKSTPFFK